MSDRQKHTPEQSDNAQDSMEFREYQRIVAAQEREIRAAACVNACAGLSPEAIPALVEAAARLTSIPEGSHLCLGAHDNGPHHGAAVDAWNAMHDALAAVRGSK